MESRPGLRSGEKQSPSEVFAKHYEDNLPKVYRYIRYRVGNTTVAEDLTSAVFEKALDKFGSYRTDKGALSTWLISIARNTVVDHYRAAARRRTVPLEEAIEVPSQDASPEEEAVRQEEIQKLQGYLAKLSQREQEIISMKFGAELHNREIAKVTGLSESNVGVTLYRAILKLRSEFGVLK